MKFEEEKSKVEEECEKQKKQKVVDRKKMLLKYK